MAQRKETHAVNLKGDANPRNLLIFMDGTWNDENGRHNDGAVTNIYKLFSSLSGRLQADQIPHVRSTSKNLGLYFRGIGNDEDNVKAAGYYQGAFGAGEKNIRDHAYASICKYYNPGDRICIFGFSRGVASARLLASKLHKHGLPEEITLHYREMKNKSSGSKEWQFSKYSAREENTEKVDVSFLGIFDTVGAFGIPFNIGPLNFQKINLFRDLSLAPNVKQGVHLVAIDESRKAFVPTLTNFSKRVEEVWFAGVHADIGGGYHDCLLGNITLDYLVRRLRATIQSPDITFNNTIRKYTSFDLLEDDFIVHYHGDGITKDARALQVVKNEKPTRSVPVKVHTTAFKLQRQENFYYSERFNSFSTKIPINYDPSNLKAIIGDVKKVV
tara:strand:+ start:2096 stop:3253 length:1158 start_codon:yes stop_codon:yes gene_type:complete